MMSSNKCLNLDVVSQTFPWTFPKQLFPNKLFSKQLFPEQLFPKQLFPEQLFPKQLFPKQLFSEPMERRSQHFIISFSISIVNTFTDDTYKRNFDLSLVKGNLWWQKMFLKNINFNSNEANNLNLFYSWSHAQRTLTLEGILSGNM